MEYGKTKLIEMLTNVPNEGWSRQKVKDMVDTLWRNPVMLRWSGFEFAGGTDCNISFNVLTREFTVAPKINVFTYYQYRNKLTYHVMSKAYQVTIANTQGLHLIYFDADPTTKAQVLLSTMPDQDEAEEIYLYKVAVAFLYFIPEDIGIGQPASVIYFGDSRHGSEWPNQVHWWNHRSLNSLRAQGLTITQTKVDRDGSLNTHAQFDITSGEVLHSDILKAVDGDSPASLPIWYMVSGAPNIVYNAGYAFYVSGTACYNPGSGPVPAQDGYFVMYHIFATNCLLTPLISAMGLAEYETIGDAAKAKDWEIDQIRQTFVQSNMMLIDTVIFQTSADYENTVKTRMVALANKDIYVDDATFDPVELSIILHRTQGMPDIEIPISIFSDMSIVGEGSLFVPFTLKNDQSAPGPLRLYSTNKYGIKGWWKLYSEDGSGSGTGEGSGVGSGSGDPDDPLLQDRYVTELLFDPITRILRVRRSEGLPDLQVEIPGGTGENGTDGREVELSVVGDYVVWRYVGEAIWINLVALSAITGPTGDTGTAGADGKEIELQVNAGWVEWRYVGDVSWTQLYEIEGGGIAIGDWVEDIAFDFNDVDTTNEQTYILDIKASFAYRILSTVLQSDGSIDDVAIKINSTAVTGLSSIDVTISISDTSSSAANSVAINDKVILYIPGTGTDDGTLIRGKIRIERS